MIGVGGVSLQGLLKYPHEDRIQVEAAHDDVHLSP